MSRPIVGKKAIDILKEKSNIEVPYHVWTVFGEETKKITFAGDQACLGCDYKNITELRTAIEWYAAQMGGTVKWEK